MNGARRAFAGAALAITLTATGGAAAGAHGGSHGTQDAGDQGLHARTGSGSEP